MVLQQVRFSQAGDEEDLSVQCAADINDQLEEVSGKQRKAKHKGGLPCERVRYERFCGEQ